MGDPKNRRKHSNNELGLCLDLTLYVWKKKTFHMTVGELAKDDIFTNSMTGYVLFPCTLMSPFPSNTNQV